MNKCVVEIEYVSNIKAVYKFNTDREANEFIQRLLSGKLTTISYEENNRDYYDVIFTDKIVYLSKVQQLKEN